MLNQAIDIIKNTTITTIGLIVGLFGVDNSDFLGPVDVDLQNNQEQSIELSDFAQANILEAIDENNTDELVDVTDSLIETQQVSEIEKTQETTDVVVKKEIEEKKETDYFEKEDIPIPIFARPESSVAVSQTKETSEDEQGELITLGEGTVEEVRAVNPIKSTKVKKEIDVSLILSTNFDKFDPKLQIVEIKEDDENFYVSYQYKTLAIEDRVWGEVLKKKNISIAKKVLDDEDLGEFLSEELAEVIDTEIIYLKEVQEIQKIKKEKAERLARAQVKKTTATGYSSLIGRILDVEENDFGGYEPIVKEEEAEETTIVSEISRKKIKKEIKTNTEETSTTETTTPVAEVKTTSTGVVDNQAPMLVIQGNNPALIQIGSSYVDLGAKVTDNISEGIGVKVSGDIVNTDVKGSYFVTYTATDEAGNIATATREVIVYDYGAAPEVEQVANNTSSQQENVVEEPIQEIADVPATTSNNEESEEIIEIPVATEEVSTTTLEVVPTEESSSTEPTIPVEEVATTSVEVEESSAVSDVVDVVTEVVQETINVASETTVDVIDTAVEATLETVGESVENVIETTNEITEEITAMMKNIKFRELFSKSTQGLTANISASIKNLTSNISKSTQGLTANINDSSIDFKNILGRAYNSVEKEIIPLTKFVYISINTSIQNIKNNFGFKKEKLLEKDNEFKPFLLDLE